ncbi:lymphocyte antigen 75-like [Labrus mixtus]|uniref:lymphocyte antigen 75-like n=1 Tax=Labrus mixtus TaxID=508554 RepID=UPI0029BFC0C0|nr:lymphocyte antigen 75-like [Labrus mixtus]
MCVLLTGWNISSCLPSQYHYVAEPMTWTEAQTYCRETYTDLATVENIEEMDQLLSTVPSLLDEHFVWIGLYSKIEWKWSDGYTESGADYRNWHSAQPDFHRGQFCALIDNSGTLWDHFCSHIRNFICYTGTQQDPEFVFVKESMSWSDAQKHCRENFIDLATVRNFNDTEKILSRVQEGGWVWIGLYRDPDINWSNGSPSTYTYWKDIRTPLGSMSVVCGAAEMPTSGQWILSDCETKLPFVCYSPASKQQVIKLRMKPEDSTVDLNDPAVKADILKKLQNRLKEKGLSGVTLKWKEQPDGKVFHKEEKCSQKKNDENFKLCT